MQCSNKVEKIMTIFWRISILNNFTHIHTYIHIYIHTHIHTYIHTYINTYIHTDRQTCRQTDTWLDTTDRETDRQTDRQTDIQVDRQTGSQLEFLLYLPIHLVLLNVASPTTLFMKIVIRLINQSTHTNRIGQVTYLSNTIYIKFLIYEENKEAICIINLQARLNGFTSFIAPSISRLCLAIVHINSLIKKHTFVVILFYRSRFQLIL